MHEHLLVIFIHCQCNSILLFPLFYTQRPTRVCCCQLFWYRNEICWSMVSRVSPGALLRSWSHICLFSCCCAETELEHSSEYQTRVQQHTEIFPSSWVDGSRDLFLFISAIGSKASLIYALGWHSSSNLSFSSKEASVGLPLYSPRVNLNARNSPRFSNC